MLKRFVVLILGLSLVLAACDTGSKPVTPDPNPSGIKGNYDEAKLGDLSGDRLAPTQLAIAKGDTLIAGSTIRDDLDYVTFSVPEGRSFVGFAVTKYTSIDAKGFVGLQKGKTFSKTPAEIQAEDGASLLGWLFLDTEGLGANRLAEMGEAPGTIGFSAPLAAGDYTLWIQQTGLATDYEIKLTLE